MNEEGNTMNTPPEVFDLGTDDLMTRSTFDTLGDAVEQFEAIGE